MGAGMNFGDRSAEGQGRQDPGDGEAEGRGAANAERRSLVPEKTGPGKSPAGTLPQGVEAHAQAHEGWSAVPEKDSAPDDRPDPAKTPAPEPVAAPSAPEKPRRERAGEDDFPSAWGRRDEAGSDRNPDGSKKEKDGGDKNNPAARKGPRPVFWIFATVLSLMLLFQLFPGKPVYDPIEFSAFKEKVRTGEIRRVQLGKDLYLGFPDTAARAGAVGGAGNGNPGKGPNAEGADVSQEAEGRSGRPASRGVYGTVPVTDAGFVALLDSMKVEYFSRPIAGEALRAFFFTWLMPLLLLVGLWFLFLPRMTGGMGGGLMALGRSRAKLVSEGDIKVTFADVAGVDEAKEELHEIIDYLRRPARYQAIGGKVPKGVLLVGPPGTGKTLLARAVAGEAKVPFFRMSGAEFVEMIVGVGAARVRDLFKQAREKAPCIVFIDELDAIGKSRAHSMGGHDEREQTLNQLLVEMDGFDSRLGVIVLAATNRPEILDPALLRPGRFDRHVLVDKPDLSGREAILRRHAGGVVIDPSVDFRHVAQKTPGLVGADLANIINEGALLAVRAGRDRVLQEDLDEAIEKVMAGLKKKNRLMNPTEKKRVAYHEIGHALVAAFTPGSDRVEKISIVPRGLGALGYTMQLPTEDRYLLTQGELLGKIDVLLGGRASEEIIFGDYSTGAANDLSRATEIAREMITLYGMSDRFRHVALSDRAAGFLGNGKEPFARREHSEATQQYVDEQIAAMLASRYDKVLQLLRGKAELLELAARRLLETETITAQEFAELARAHGYDPDHRISDEEERGRGGRVAGPGPEIQGRREPAEKRLPHVPALAQKAEGPALRGFERPAGSAGAPS